MKKYFLKIIYLVLKSYAKTVIARHDPIVIAVTGSVGKTTTKEAIYAVLRDEYGDKVRATTGNLNAELGIPLTILGYDKVPNKFLLPFFLIPAYFKTKTTDYPKYLVIEIGIENPGDMKYYTEIVKPDYVVITAATAVHIANFTDVESYREEKISILKSLSQDGQAILNYDDPVLSRIHGEQILGVGVENEKADYQADNIIVDLDGTEFRINCLGRKIAVKSKIVGRQMIYGQLFAFALANLLGIQLMKAKDSIERLQAYPGRMNVIAGKDNTTIIDDTYNSNPTSLKAGLDTLAEIKSKGRKVAIIGNMNELGSEERKLHQEIGRYAKDKCDFAIFVGENAELMRDSYGEKNTSLSFPDRKSFLAEVNSLVRSGDLVYIKASQNNNYLEEAVKILMKDPAKAEKLLVRQSRSWLKKKNS